MGCADRTASLGSGPKNPVSAVVSHCVAITVSLPALSVRLCSITSKRELGAGKRTKHIGVTVMEPDSYVLFFFLIQYCTELVISKPL